MIEFVFPEIILKKALSTSRHIMTFINIYETAEVSLKTVKSKSQGYFENFFFHQKSVNYAPW